MVVKGLFGDSGCSLNVGTSASVGSWADPKDTNFTSMQDLISYGGYSGNQTLAKILVDETQDRINEQLEIYPTEVDLKYCKPDKLKS